ncbi:AAA domain-containing protein [Pseudonocardia sp. CA-107938]|uniref:AAA domain-containing protein n=1 Tax=Pseudonocardia sp. CA-107938 TaxID=3240021 RepID=UPI003D93BBC9
MAPAVLHDDETLQRTTQLINFLARVTDAANRHPRRDICAGSADSRPPLIWLDDIPAGIDVRLDADGDEPILAIKPVPLIAPPAPPVELRERINPEKINDIDREPVLGPPDTDDEMPVAGEDRLRTLFGRWLAGWRAWAADERPRRALRQLYDQLEAAAKTMEQQDDAFECVIATGLVCWRANDVTIRRHLLTEPVRPAIDRRTAEVRVTRVGGRRRMEDAEVFHDQPCYLPERGRGRREAILTSEMPMDSGAVRDELHEWLGLAITVPVDAVAARIREGMPLPSLPQLSTSPAFLMRPRSQVLVAEAYRRIANELADPGVAVPVGLAQLVVDTERAQRDGWLASQGADRGDLLGDDPLFPLAANDEQQRVMELLRTETGVVVQGPPGTGKTHTIANLVSALLARGQRILVTSQKEQALKVLRDHIPEELRHLCVLLAGGSRDAAAELQKGLDAFSSAQASADRRRLQEDVLRYATERDNLRGRSVSVNREIANLRAVENQVHGPVVAGFTTDRYYGPLVQIVRDVQREAPQHDWMPPVPAGVPDFPPLNHAELLELLDLLRQPETALAARAGQLIPDPDQLPSPGHLAELRAAIEHATTIVHRDGTALSRQLASLGEPELGHLETLGDQVAREMVACGLSPTGTPGRAPQWVVRAIGDRLAGQRAGLWGHLLEVPDEARQLQRRLQAQGVRFVVEIPDITAANLGTAKGWINTGSALLGHVRGGGKFRNLVQKKVQRDAEPLMHVVRVDGAAPNSAEQLAAVLEHLAAAVAAVQLAQKWAYSDVPITGSGSLPALLSELADNAARLMQVEKLASVHRAVVEHLGRCGLSLDLSTVASLVEIRAAIPAARQQHVLWREEQRLDQFQRHIRDLATEPGSCAELAQVLSSVVSADPRAYSAAVDAVAAARREQAAHRRLQELHGRLGSAHPELAALLRNTAHEPAWNQRIAAAADAWAWSKAQQFVALQRNADRERELFSEFERIDSQLKVVTKRLVHAHSMVALLDRMTDAHARALNSYREHMSKIGAGTGKKTSEFRKAARAAMRKAQDAVPAWVVPLPTLLENLDAERDRFDVVIVDEASQVGIEHLYLLWMAPRVIVVGDDKQCTPGPARLGDLATLFNQSDALMPDIDHDIRRLFTQKNNLYGVLSARSGRDALIRLREHFRCVPEIINFSSQNFYPDNSGKPGLIPLRERKAGDLEPLKVVHVEDAAAEGRDDRKKNPREAKAIVEEMGACLRDARYDGKSFGVIVLQGQGQIKLLQHEINAAILLEDREQRKIRVGSAADFQGDERDIIFLSMVVSERPYAMTAESHNQSYNVAASRAKDQMWLFVSVPRAELKPEDLRAKLLDYMLNPPSVFGASPSLDEVPADRPCEPFDSMFEQRVFREIKRRGYHVVPQYQVGSRCLDLVVSGAGAVGRIGVECDGHHWHTSIDDQRNDARRDLELARQRWQVVRLRESEFEFDPERELRRVWDLLDARGIIPAGAVE